MECTVDDAAYNVANAGAQSSRKGTEEQRRQEKRAFFPFSLAPLRELTLQKLEFAGLGCGRFGLVVVVQLDRGQACLGADTAL